MRKWCSIPYQGYLTCTTLTPCANGVLPHTKAEPRLSHMQNVISHDNSSFTIEIGLVSKIRLCMDEHQMVWAGRMSEGSRTEGPSYETEVRRLVFGEKRQC
ncbi:hypothetical protein V6N11_054515 [Hibiscus sabdariffa]|uniref:Uncharacterized protein n=1 Tax=Hibiscus sabdariffa TaxID=183260 RepID=A0ABR2S508_9ROSI